MMNKIKTSPKLADTKAITKYIKKIDTNRYYSNFGPLYQYTVKKISRDYDFKKNNVILTSSGHSSLFACFLYLKTITKKKYILVPSFNFYSSPHAIIQSGFEPYFIDINKDNYSLNHESIQKAFYKLKNNVAGIVAVSPFGYPLNIKNLNLIQKKFNTRVIYDAADTFINFNKKIDNSKILICCSFHPTKTLPANESGMILCQNNIFKILKSIISFGVSGKNKEVLFSGFNGKFSEYDAAIFLANYNHKSEIKKKLFKKIKYFTNKFNNLDKQNISMLEGFGNTWVSTKICFISKKGPVGNLQKKFNKFRVEIYPAWNKKPLHKHSFFKHYKGFNLKNTSFISKKFFIIPINLDSTKKNMDLIIKSINRVF